MSEIASGTWLTVRRQRIVKVKCNKDYGEGTCEGEITMWDRPSDWKTFPKCAKHLAEAVQEFERIDQRGGVLGGATDEHFVASGDPVGHSQRSAADLLEPGLYHDSIVEAGALVVVDFHAGRGEVETSVHVGRVGLVVLLEPDDACFLEIPQEVRVVDDAHRVGLVEGDAARDLGRVLQQARNCL